jgi:hypothetical protein
MIKPGFHVASPFMDGGEVLHSENMPTQNPGKNEKGVGGIGHVQSSKNPSNLVATTSVYRQVDLMSECPR